MSEKDCPACEYPTDEHAEYCPVFKMEHAGDALFRRVNRMFSRFHDEFCREEYDSILDEIAAWSNVKSEINDPTE